MPCIFLLRKFLNLPKVKTSEFQLYLGNSECYWSAIKMFLITWLLKQLCQAIIVINDIYHSANWNLIHRILNMEFNFLNSVQLKRIFVQWNLFNTFLFEGNNQDIIKCKTITRHKIFSFCALWYLILLWNLCSNRTRWYLGILKCLLMQA